MAVSSFMVSLGSPTPDAPRSGLGAVGATASGASGATSRPQLPRRSNQDHLVPQLREAPVPRVEDEHAVHDPGLVAAFRRGVDLAEARSAEDSVPDTAYGASPEVPAAVAADPSGGAPANGPSALDALADEGPAPLPVRGPGPRRGPEPLPPAHPEPHLLDPHLSDPLAPEPHHLDPYVPDPRPSDAHRTDPYVPGYAPAPGSPAENTPKE